MTTAMTTAMVMTSETTAGTAVAVLLGTGTGLGLVLIAVGLRRSAPRPRRRFDRARLEGASVRLAVAVGCAIVAGAVTRWPIGAGLAGAAAWWTPRVLGPDRQHARRVARIEAIASWAESLRDTLAAAAGLEQTILATAPVAPAPIAAEVTELANRLEQGERLPAALRAFVDRLADPTADLVVAALLLAAEQQAKDLGHLLGRLAAAARDQAGMRMRIAAARARMRSSVRIIVGCTVVLTVGLLAWSRSYLHPYDSVVGQVVLFGIGLCFTAAFAWLERISRMDEQPRVLTGLTTGGRP
jgi:Flp pilus assembly protein TadB